MRKRRKRSVPVETFLKPILIYDLGDEEKDPCFGKHYDLTEIECQACGDKEFCAVVTAQRLKVKRIEEEKKVGALDKQLSKDQLFFDIKSFVEDFISQGKSKSLAIVKASKKFKMSKDKIKTLI